MTTTAAPAELRFRAMGSDVHVLVNGPAGLLEVARDRVEELERRWSRFRPDSEISRLNALAGSPMAVSVETLGLANVLVPLTGDWHPLAVAWGIAGMYLLLAVELTSLARPRVPRRLWRRVHYAGFAVYLLTTVHGLAAGTDGRAPAFLVANAVVAALVAGLTASVSRPPAPSRWPGPAGPAAQRGSRFFAASTIWVAA
jgi:hypothetical protein